MRKSHFSAMAINGGGPAFEQPLHVGRPNIGNRQQLLARVNDMLDRRWLSNDGPFAKELEQRVAEYLAVKHCIVMSSATVALEITIRALELHDEVIVPSFTFIATAHALQWQGITPVFCDVDPSTHNLDPVKVESLITSRTTGILGVHVWGRPCAIDSLSEIAQRHDLKLMFDAAHAFGCSYKHCMIGHNGAAEVFSFHATKFFNTFEGGAVTTNDDALATKLRLMKNFGFTGYDKVVYVGTNGKMSEISAAMGLTGLESLDGFIKVNRRNYEAYRNGLKNIPGVQIIAYNEEEQNNYQYVVVEIDEVMTGISRDALLRVLHAENILARRYFYPGCHQMEPYNSLFPGIGMMLPETEKLTQRVLSLPTGTAVSEEDIEIICTIIKLAVENSEAIRQIMPEENIDD